MRIFKIKTIQHIGNHYGAVSRNNDVDDYINVKCVNAGVGVDVEVEESRMSVPSNRILF